jgi:MOSC domain-containing protein YiiM
MSVFSTTSAEVLSINVGLPMSLHYRNKVVISGIYKEPAENGAYLHFLNFEGDRQADLEHHGGSDKAVCVYPSEHYRYWEKVLQRQITPGAFGENLTTMGLQESQLYIGDIFQIGEAVVQISQPRQPCYKLSIKYERNELPLLVQTTGYTGYYFRVLKEGLVNKGDSLVLLLRLQNKVTVAYANTIMHMDKDNMEGINCILDIPWLSASWRKTLTNRREGIATDTIARLEGT